LKIDFKGKKIYLDINDKILESRIKEILKGAVFVDSESLADIRLSNREKDGYVYVNFIKRDFLGFVSHFLKDLYRLYFYKGIYFVFNREFKEDYDRLYHILFTLISLFFVFLAIPPDDLLRHLVAYRYGYDYSKVFIDANMPSWNFYLPFDFVVGFFHQFWHSIGSYFGVDFITYRMPIVSVNLIVFFLVFYLVNVAFKDYPLVYRAFFISLFYFVSSGRFFLARPTVFAALLFLIAVVMFLQKREKQGLFFSGLIGLFYYLNFLYFIPLLFFSRKVIFVAVASFIYWTFIAYFQGHSFYILDVYKYILTLNNDAVIVGENFSILLAFSKPVLVLVLILVFLYFKDVDRRYIYSSLWFSISNQIRYFEVIGPLLVFSLANKIKEGFLDKVLKGSYFSIFILSLSLFMASSSFFINSDLPDKKICDYVYDKKVKATLGGNFRLVYMCENVKVNPSMEIRWNKDLSLDLAILEGKDLCNEKLYKYDYLYLNSLKGFNSCLKMEYGDGKWILWRVIK
jgi:hypothetical protein